METEYITKERVEQYELLQPLLSGLYNEFKELSKKKPDSPININKGKLVNRVLEPLQVLFCDEKVVMFLDVLDLDELPTNSDVILVLNQYLKATTGFKDKYYHRGNRKWKVTK